MRLLAERRAGLCGWFGQCGVVTHIGWTSIARDPLRPANLAWHIGGMTDQPAKDDYADSLEAALISDMVSGGETVVAACRTLGVSVNTTYGRLGRSERFREMMEKAREAGFDVIAENVRRVTRGEAGHSSGDVKRDRLIVETDMKLLAKWHPHRYGEKLQIEQKSATVAIPTSDDPIAAQRAYEQLISGKG